MSNSVEHLSSKLNMRNSMNEYVIIWSCGDITGHSSLREVNEFWEDSQVSHGEEGLDSPKMVMAFYRGTVSHLESFKADLRHEENEHMRQQKEQRQFRARDDAGNLQRKRITKR